MYLVRGENDIFEPICGLHDSDKRLRVRLNASRAKDLLAEELRVQRVLAEDEPESVEITLNEYRAGTQNFTTVVTARPARVIQMAMLVLPESLYHMETLKSMPSSI